MNIYEAFLALKEVCIKAFKYIDYKKYPNDQFLEILEERRRELRRG